MIQLLSGSGAALVFFGHRGAQHRDGGLLGGPGSGVGRSVRTGSADAHHSGCSQTRVHRSYRVAGDSARLQQALDRRPMPGNRRRQAVLLPAGLLPTYELYSELLPGSSTVACTRARK